MRDALLGWGGGRSSFMNPFADLHALTMPQQLRVFFKLCEHIWIKNGEYRSAHERKALYFLTEVEFDDADDEEQKKHKEFLHDHLDILGNLESILNDRTSVGNSFISILFPFKRMLHCSTCKSVFSFEEAAKLREFSLTLVVGGFSGTCPRCRKTGKFHSQQIESNDENKIKLKRWSIHEIDIIHHTLTGTNTYRWTIPQEFRDQILRPSVDQAKFWAETPQTVLDAVLQNRSFEFAPDQLFHLYQRTLSGLRTRGWGLPQPALDYGQLVYVQLLKCTNEALTSDYTVPVRVISPEVMESRLAFGDNVPNDPIFGGGLGGGRKLRNMIQGMVQAKRHDPTSIFTSPIPLKQTLLGGDVQQLVPAELTRQAKDDLLAQSNVPVEFYRGTMQLQAAPVALRLFQATNSQLVGEANRCVRWIVDRLSSTLGWEKVKPRLMPVGVADDIQRQAMLLQLMMSGKVSTTEALRALNLSYPKQQRLIRDETIRDMELQQEMQEAANQKGLSLQLQQGAPPGAAPAGAAPAGAPAPPPGAAPPAGGAVAGAPPLGYDPNDPVGSYLSMASSTPSTPEDFAAQASSLAMQLKALPEGLRRQQLSKLKTGKPPMHRQVIGELASLRSQDRSTGYAMLQQMQGAGGQQPAPMGA